MIFLKKNVTHSFKQKSAKAKGRDCNEKNDPSILSCGAFYSDFSPNLHKIH